MNFKISEKEKTFWDEKEHFIQLYNQEKLMKEILKECNLTTNQYCKLVKECTLEGKITPRRKTMLKK